MSLPSPKDVLRQIAKTSDQITEAIAAPVKQFMTTLGLPTVELPKASDIVESLPELPQPPSPAMIPLTPAPTARQLPTTLPSQGTTETLTLPAKPEEEIVRIVQA